MVMQGKRALTLEEFLRLPPPTKEELAELREKRRRVLDEVRREVDAFVSSGGKLASREEWQETWDWVHYGDEDDD